MLSHQTFRLRMFNHFGLQPFDLFPGWGFVDDFNVGQNVPPPMPVVAVKSVNVPGAGPVLPMIVLLISPPLMI